ncbi:MAG: hypothetical protein H6705_04545 [Myxococcales bacterium]|nr:hypothetical protein [Myxococcales bacterium]
MKRLLFAALLLAACDDGSPAGRFDQDAGLGCLDALDCPDGYACFDGRCVFQGGGAPEADAGAPAPPEAEIDLSPAAPAAGRDHVWITLPHNDAIARIHGQTLAVTVIEVGDDPHVVRAVAGEDTAVVLTRGDDRLTVVRHAAGADTLTAHDLPGHFNALDLAPDGRHAIAWFDLTAARPGEDAAAIQDIAVLDLATGALHPIAIGFAPRRVAFADGDALIVTDDGLSIIRLDDLDGPAIAPTIPLAPDVFSQADREVVLTPDGRHAASRGPGEPGITVVDLTEAIPRFIPLGAEPTDLDLLPDGTALVMLREARRLALVPLATAADPATHRVIGYGDLPLGSAVVSPRGDRAFLFATRPDAPPAAALLALPSGDLARVPLRKRALGAAIDPDGHVALVLHAPEAPGGADPRPAPDAGLDADAGPDPDAAPEPEPDAAPEPEPDADADPAPDAEPAEPPLDDSGPGVDPELAPRPGYSLVDLDTAFVKLTLTPAPVTAITFAPGDLALLALRADPAIAELHRLDLTRFDARRDLLGSPPRALGVLPAVDRAFVTQDHPTGRIGFVPLTTDGRIETVTGFALNGRIE